MYLFSNEGRWSVNEGPDFEAAATEENARYCLDVVVSIIRNQETRKNIARSRPEGRWRARITNDTPLLKRASLNSANTGEPLRAGAEYAADAVVGGIDDVRKYVHIHHVERNPFVPIDGFILQESCILTDW